MTTNDAQTPNDPTEADSSAGVSYAASGGYAPQRWSEEKPKAAGWWWWKYDDCEEPLILAVNQRLDVHPIDGDAIPRNAVGGATARATGRSKSGNQASARRLTITSNGNPLAWVACTAGFSGE